MHLDNFFQDLEGQLAAEREAERAALDSEAERLRISRLAMRQRIGALKDDGAGDVEAVRLELVDGSFHEARIEATGADWFAARIATAATLLIRFEAVVTISVGEPMLLRSARAAEGSIDRLADRITFGFALRDLARRRVAVTMGTTSGRSLTGTLDRVGADHADIALHEPGAPRRATEVSGFRILPLSHIAHVRVDAVDGTSIPGR